MLTGQKTDLMHRGAKQKNTYPNKNENFTRWHNGNVVCSLGVKKKFSWESEANAYLNTTIVR